MSSLFSKIIKGEIPSFKIYEDEYTFAFLDINPINLGHTLIVPKIEHDHFLDVPEPYYSAVFKAAVPIGKAIMKATSCKRIGSVILGFDVPHFHYHVLPLWDASDVSFKKAKSRETREMENIQKSIVENLA
ncbi:MAG: HIT family protein [Bdellovibrionota bacterium]|nr:HIT family protein [Bdellovibrionota bacterium]